MARSLFHIEMRKDRVQAEEGASTLAPLSLTFCCITRCQFSLVMNRFRVIFIY